MAHHPLRDGQSVDLRDTLTHGQEKHILRAVSVARTDPAAQAEVPDGYLLAFVVGWSVRDETGDQIPWPEDEAGRRAAIDRTPSTTTDVIFRLCFQAYGAWRKGADDRGKPVAATSPGSAPG